MDFRDGLLLFYIEMNNSLINPTIIDATRNLEWKNSGNNLHCRRVGKDPYGRLISQLIRGLGGLNEVPDPAFQNFVLADE